jgi:hypothetical protein
VRRVPPGRSAWADKSAAADESQKAFVDAPIGFSDGAGRVGKGAPLRAVPTLSALSIADRVGTAHAIERMAPLSLVRVRLCPPYESRFSPFFSPFFSLLRFPFSFFLFLSPYVVLAIRYSLLLLPPRSKGGRSADRRPGAAAPGRPAMTLRARHPAGCLPPSTEGGAPLGAPPWRFLGRGPRFLLRHFLRIRAASSSQPSHSAWRAGPRASRG